MLFGIYASVDNSTHVRAAGWDFIEENAQHILQPLTPELEWRGIERARAALLPVPVVSHCAPADFKIAGPQVSMPKLHAYTTTLLKRASLAGVRTIIFSTGHARTIPAGFDLHKAADQIISFLTMIGPMAAQHGVTVAIEPVCRKESNLINTTREALAYVAAVNHANIKCAFSTYHFWQENEPLENLAAVAGSLVHVHLADRDGRAAPGATGASDYRPIFQVLQASGFKGTASVHCDGMPTAESQAGRVLTFLRRQWQAAGGG
jgi:sugar phosphate isomerase/epimerase